MFPTETNQINAVTPRDVQSTSISQVGAANVSRAENVGRIFSGIPGSSIDL
jgi:hypothetical protein